jgi:hypothetical protein
MLLCSIYVVVEPHRTIDEMETMASSSGGRGANRVSRRFLSTSPNVNTIVLCISAPRSIRSRCYITEQLRSSSDAAVHPHNPRIELVLLPHILCTPQELSFSTAELETQSD